MGVGQPVGVGGDVGVNWGRPVAITGLPHDTVVTVQVVNVGELVVVAAPGPVAEPPVWPGGIGLTGLGVEGGVEPRVMSAYETSGDRRDGHTVAAEGDGVRATLDGAVLWSMVMRVSWCGSCPPREDDAADMVEVRLCVLASSRSRCARVIRT